MEETDELMNGDSSPHYVHAKWKRLMSGDSQLESGVGACPHYVRRTHIL